MLDCPTAEKSNLIRNFENWHVDHVLILDSRGPTRMIFCHGEGPEGGKKGVAEGKGLEFISNAKDWIAWQLPNPSCFLGGFAPQTRRLGRLIIVTASTILVWHVGVIGRSSPFGLHVPSPVAQCVIARKGRRS